MDNQKASTAKKVYQKPGMVKVELVPEDSIMVSGINGNGYSECITYGSC